MRKRPESCSVVGAVPSVAMIAFACTPDAGSEPGVGWQFAACAANLPVKLTVFTRRDESTSNVSSALTSLGLDATVVSVPTRLDRYAGSPLLRYPRYAIWLKKVQGRLDRSEDFDIVHHVTYASDWLPSIKPRRSRLVWGPVGGATHPPRSLLQFISMKGRVRSLARRLIGDAIRATLCRPTLRSAQPCIALNDDTSRKLGALGAAEVVVRSNAVIDCSALSDVDEFSEAHPPAEAVSKLVNVVMAGRLIEWKGYKLAWTALRASRVPWVLNLYGEGPYRATIEREASDLIAAGLLVLHGAVDRAELLRVFRDNTDLFLFPSLHDSAGWVVAEAASFGNTVACFDFGGAHILAGENARIISVTDPIASINKYVGEAADHETAGRSTAKHFQWSKAELTKFLSSTYLGT